MRDEEKERGALVRDHPAASRGAGILSLFSCALRLLSLVWRVVSNACTSCPTREERGVQRRKRPSRVFRRLFKGTVVAIGGDATHNEVYECVDMY